MPVIYCQERRIETAGDNVLSSLERAGIRLPGGGCGTGHCQGCVARLSEGRLPPAAQRGLNQRQRALNYFLACQFQPDADIAIDLLDAQARRSARLVEKTPLSDGVLRVRLESAIDWRAGQYLTLWRGDHLGRQYSVASRPEEGFIELHVRRRDGVVSGWLERDLAIGKKCRISLPRGDCYYSPAMPGQPVLMVGLGTGLAPVYGVLKDALAAGHHGGITLYAVAGTLEQLYLLEDLEALCRDHRNVEIVPVTRRGHAGIRGAERADVIDVVARRHAHLRGSLVYLCGNPAVVRELQHLCFMRGAHTGDIFFDAFDYR